MCIFADVGVGRQVCERSSVKALQYVLGLHCLFGMMSDVSLDVLGASSVCFFRKRAVQSVNTS